MLVKGEMKKDELDRLYSRATQVDRKLFAEMRTNILLRNGEHYNKRASRVIDDLRSREVVSNDQKIRITKNHIHRITNAYINHILEGNPSVTVSPYNPRELHDVKVAQMNNSVVCWVKETNNWDNKQSKFVHDFIVEGEAIAKLYFDYTRGQYLGEDEEGNAKYSGQLYIERVFPFDLKRDPQATDWDECRYVIHDKMVDLEVFKSFVKKLNPDLLEKVQASEKKTYRVWDANTGDYVDNKDQALIREWIFRPSPMMPNGWYVLDTEDFIIAQSELPNGLFPVVYEGFDELTSSPRSTSIIRVCRPYQIEINRAASKMAEHQITLGDDKVYMPKGSKISEAGYVAGVRAISFTGAVPVVQEGRTGNQYLDYQLSQVREMYEAVDLAFLFENQEPKGDAWLMLYASMKQKKKFVKYVSKYESFEKKVFKLALQLCKFYLDDNHIIKIVGKAETLNVPEFKQTSDEGYEFKIESIGGDIETQFGKALTFSQMLQYAGTSLSPDQLGEIIKEMPYTNYGKTFSTLTSPVENAENDILAFDRGEFIPARSSDEHELMIKAFKHRMKAADFRFLDPKIQLNYESRVLQHEQFLEQQSQLAQQNAMGMIPMEGFLTTVNASWLNPATNEVERIKVPSSSIAWLVNKLNQQGAYLNSVKSLPLDAQAQLGVMNNNAQAPIINTAASQQQGLTESQGVNNGIRTA